MSRVLILYGTTDGHTEKIAATLAATLREEGSAVAIVNARRASADALPSQFDGVIVAASVHISNYQRAVKRWVQAHAVELNHVPSAFVSVCLAILESRPEAQRAVREIAEQFLRRLGWQPTVTKTVAGALPYTRYNWLKKWIMKRIAAKTSGDTDTTRDFEYTNWDDLRQFARDFASKCALTAGAQLQPLP